MQVGDYPKVDEGVVGDPALLPGRDREREDGDRAERNRDDATA
jgi:hypothetical protein